MPEGRPPQLPPSPIEDELQLTARSILVSRHPEIPLPLLDDLILNDDALRLEHDQLIADLRPARNKQHSLIRLLAKFGQGSHG